MRLQFKLMEGDSSFYFRADPVPGLVEVHGLQVEIDTTYETGGLYETGGRAWVVHHDPDTPTRWYRRQEWNTLTLSAHGRNIVVRMNGRRCAKLVNDPGRLEGHFGLQLHGGQKMDVRFKDLALLVPAGT